MGNLKQFTDGISSRIKSIQLLGKFKGRSKKKKGPSVTVIEINDDGFAVVEVSFDSGAPRILNCQFVNNTNPTIRSELIAELFERRNIGTSTVKLVLSDSKYKFLLAEAPNAALEGLRAIMPSKIKDSLPWKLSEVTADVLPLPTVVFLGQTDQKHPVC